MSNIIQAVGVNQLWGFSPALDLLSSSPTQLPLPQGEDDTIDVLLLFPGDVRHVLKTLAYWRRHVEVTGGRRVRVFVFEDTTVALARQVLFLHTAVDTSLGVEARTHLLLEMLGNLHLHEKTAEYLRSQSQQVIDMFVREEGTLLELGLLDLSHLKFREKDDVEATFKYWREQPELDIESLWDHRLRHYYAERYDVRLNLMDWDYHMLMKQHIAIVHEVLYKRWRARGLAFEWRERGYTVPNFTLATFREGMDRKRGPVGVRGYWGDILVSPYIAFGVESDEERLFEIRQAQHVKTCVHVSEYNVESLLTEYQTGEPLEYVDKAAQRRKQKEQDPEAQLAAMVMVEEEPDDGNDDDDERKLDDGDGDGEEEEAEPEEAVPAHFDQVKLTVVPLTGDAKKVLGKRKYEAKFHRVVVSSSYAHLITPELNKCLAPGAHVSVETFKYLPLKKEQRAAFLDKAQELAEAANWRLAGPVYKEQAFLSFTAAE